MEQSFIYASPTFIYNIPTYYNKPTKKKQKKFQEREGDWTCSKCKNLNFAFRQECNRCKLPKGQVINDTKDNQNNKEQKIQAKNEKEPKDKDEIKELGKKQKYKKNKKNISHKNSIE
jgi:hypothetical protein